jgi:hypothetical protein
MMLCSEAGLLKHRFPNSNAITKTPPPMIHVFLTYKSRFYFILPLAVGNGKSQQGKGQTPVVGFRIQFWV